MRKEYVARVAPLSGFCQIGWRDANTPPPRKPRARFRKSAQRPWTVGAKKIVLYQKGPRIIRRRALRWLAVVTTSLQADFIGMTEQIEIGWVPVGIANSQQIELIRDRIVGI